MNGTGRAGQSVVTTYDDASRPTQIISSDGISSTTITYTYDNANNKLWEDQSISANSPLSEPIQPLSAVSRKTHGSAGPFDINLPFGGYPGVECRNDGSNTHKIVVTFASPVTFSGASVIAGTGTVSSTTGSGTTVATINLSSVTNAQTLTVTLQGVSDGTNTVDVPIQMSVLLGDVNASGLVDGNDVAIVQGQTRQLLTSNNFRCDVNVNGIIDGNDAAITQGQTRTSLPALPTITHRVQTDPDADGNRLDLLVSTNGVTNFGNHYDYTSRNQLLNIYDGGNNQFFKYSYDANGNVIQRFGSRLGDTTVMAYDGLNHPTMSVQNGFNGLNFAMSHYEYNILGNLLDTYRDEEGGKGERYGYDALNQLNSAIYAATNVSGPNANPQNPASTVSYDVGPENRRSMTVTTGGTITTTSYGPNELNQYTSINGQTVQYDNNFNLTGYNLWTYGYDAQNRMTSATFSTQLIAHSATFTYDGIGRCVRRVIDGVTTAITYDGWKPIAEWDGNGSLVATNVYGSGKDEILYRSGRSSELFYKSDPMGNVRFILNSSE